MTQDFFTREIEDKNPKTNSPAIWSSSYPNRKEAKETIEIIYLEISRNGKNSVKLINIRNFNFIR